MKNDSSAPSSEPGCVHPEIPARDEGSPSLSAGIRAAGGGATGAALGIAIGGPVGGIIGAALGALAGELSGNVSAGSPAPPGAPPPPVCLATADAAHETTPPPLPEPAAESAEPEERVPLRIQIDPQVEYALPPSSDEEIAALAWYFYETEGRPEGRAVVHWLRAERETRAGRESTLHSLQA